MKKTKLSFPQLMFIVGTRGMLASGVTLLASNRSTPSTRKKLGVTLAAIGAISTIPAARIILKGKSLRKRLGW